jgi:hypothetical protein
MACPFVIPVNFQEFAGEFPNFVAEYVDAHHSHLTPEERQSQIKKYEMWLSSLPDEEIETGREDRIDMYSFSVHEPEDDGTGGDFDIPPAFLDYVRKCLAECK